MDYKDIYEKLRVLSFDPDGFYGADYSQIDTDRFPEFVGYVAKITKNEILVKKLEAIGDKHVLYIPTYKIKKILSDFKKLEQAKATARELSLF